MPIHKIIERKFPTDHFLVRRIFSGTPVYISEESYCHVVYFNESDPQVVTAKLVYIQDWEREPEGFEYFLQEDLTFNECLILSTLYFSATRVEIERLLKQPKSFDDFLDYIVRPTNGYLLFSFQLEQLAQLLLNVPLDEAVRIRKSYNKQRSMTNPYERDSEELRLFKCVVRSRAVLGSVHLPNYIGAKNLDAYAKSIA